MAFCIYGNGKYMYNFPRYSAGVQLFFVIVVWLRQQQVTESTSSFLTLGMWRFFKKK
jgi:hypothetical protein